MEEENIILEIGKIGAEIDSNSCYKPAEPSNEMSERKEWVLGIKVRVRPEVENALRLYAEKTGWLPHSVRNVAILVGLLALARGPVKFPENIKQYKKLLEEVVKTIEMMGYEKKNK
jgi:hypothetical protein